MNLATFIQHFLNSLTLGSLYALIAIGYTMVYGILRLINFAHSEIFMLGAYFVFWGYTLFHLPWPVAMVASVVLIALVGILVDRIAYRPLRDAPRISALISAIGVSFFLQNVAIVFFQAIPREVYRPEWLENPIIISTMSVKPLTLIVFALVVLLISVFVLYRKASIAVSAESKDVRTVFQQQIYKKLLVFLVFLTGLALVINLASRVCFYVFSWSHWLTRLCTPLHINQLRVLPLTLFVPVLSFLLMLGLVYIVYHTKAGLGMRAISKDIETSSLMGVPVNKVIALTFGIGSALAAASGIMWALRYPQLQPIMGTIPGFKAFIAAVFGGIGSIQGAVIGGLALGFIEILTVAFFPDLAGYRDAFAFVLLIGVLLVKPTGLMGVKTEDKV